MFFLLENTINFLILIENERTFTQIESEIGVDFVAHKVFVKWSERN